MAFRCSLMRSSFALIFFVCSAKNLSTSSNLFCTYSGNIGSLRLGSAADRGLGCGTVGLGPSGRGVGIRGPTSEINSIELGTGIAAITRDKEAGSPKMERPPVTVVTTAAETSIVETDSASESLGDEHEPSPVLRRL
ncbi:hypothetical protein Hanom_Chr01g00052781 [Helianthus anomalus]